MGREAEGSGITPEVLARLNRAVFRAVANARHDADMTHQDLADVLGLTRNQVVNMERGRRAIKASELILIGKAVGVAPDELLRRAILFKDPRRMKRG